MKSRLGKNILLSIVISISFAAIFILLLLPGHSPLGSPFNLFIALMAIRYLSLAYGATMLLLRIVKIIGNNCSLMYILAGTFNVSLALTGYLLYASNLANREWLHLSIQNLSLGFLIFADTIYFNKKTA